MKKRTVTNTREQDKQNTVIKAKQIKLGIDAHADSYRVVRQIDNATPQPAQKFTPKDFLIWAAKQMELAQEVYSCYEAGPFGYGLHRELEKLGIKNVVVRPQNWDELGKGVKTDQTDALALVQRLDRYAQGNQKALAVVRVPSVEEEQARAQSRFREQLRRHRQQMEAQGRSLLLYLGHRVKGRWWGDKAWNHLSQTVTESIRKILERWRELIFGVEEQLQAVTQELEQAARAQPKGFGALTSQALQREICDWKRFKNRRQVASMTGLCPGVRSSGLSFHQGSITKHGNSRLRWMLVELAWRTLRYQPEYGPVKRCLSKIKEKPVPGAIKKAVVALARRLAVDLWRLETGRTTAEKLKLKMS